MCKITPLVTIQSLQREIQWREEQLQYIKTMFTVEEIYDNCHNYINTVDEINLLKAELKEVLHEHGKDKS